MPRDLAPGRGYPAAVQPVPPLRLRIDSASLAANWRALAGRSGAARCGAAVKADAYGLGAPDAVRVLRAAGCRDFFVATWAEAADIAQAAGDAEVSVLHGVSADDMAAALASNARPVLNSEAQVRRWRDSGRPCDVMVDTGMNRLGLSVEEAASGLLDGLAVETMMSHLASADEDSAQNGRQRSLFAPLRDRVRARRMSLSNSAGIFLGEDYHFDLTRPGLALYGGIPRAEAEGIIRPVVRVEARVVQRRRIAAGESVGYNATFTADRPRELAILNIGYADGYLRAFAGAGRAWAGDSAAPVVGRVSMDLTAVCVDDAPQVEEGDWLTLDYALPEASRQSGLSQYELLTGLGQRFARDWA